MADRQFKGMTVDEVKEKVTYSEFLSWVEYIRKEQQDPQNRKKEEFYLAAVRLELVRLQRITIQLLSTKNKVGPEPTLESFLLDYENKEASERKPPRKAGELTPADGKAYLAASKAAWGASIGIGVP